MKVYTNAIIICHELLSDPTDSITHFSPQFVSSTEFTQMEEKAFYPSILIYWCSHQYDCRRRNPLVTKEHKYAQNSPK